MIDEKTRTRNHRERLRAQGLVPKTVWIPAGEEYAESLKGSVKRLIKKAENNKEARS